MSTDSLLAGNLIPLAGMIADPSAPVVSHRPRPAGDPLAEYWAPSTEPRPRPANYTLSSGTARGRSEHTDRWTSPLVNRPVTFGEHTELERIAEVSIAAIERIESEHRELTAAAIESALAELELIESGEDTEYWANERALAELELAAAIAHRAL